MVRILYLTTHCGSSVGGSERQLHHLVTHLPRESYQPIVVCPGEGVFTDELRGSGIPTHVLPLPPWRKAKSLPSRRRAALRLAEFAEQQSIRLIHASDSWLNPYACHVNERLGVPAISHVRTVFDASRIRKHRFQDMNKIIAISQQTMAPLVEAGIPSERIDVILNCVDLAAFAPQAGDGHALRDEFPLRGSVVGMVGRIEPFKRQKEFLEVAARVIEVIDDVSFVIVGASHAVPQHMAYERELRQAVEQLGLNDHVVVAGHRTDMPAVMQDLDLLVTASAGSVIAEAMAAGRPVVGTPIGSTSEMIDDGATGWIVPSDRTDLMAQRIVQTLQDAGLRGRMGNEGRRRAEELFGIPEHVRRVQATYDDLLSRS